MPKSIIFREEALRKSALKCSLKGEGVDGVQCSMGNILDQILIPATRLQKPK
jgi:hypothetical protein